MNCNRYGFHAKKGFGHIQISIVRAHFPPRVFNDEIFNIYDYISIISNKLNKTNNNYVSNIIVIPNSITNIKTNEIIL